MRVLPACATRLDHCKAAADVLAVQTGSMSQHASLLTAAGSLACTTPLTGEVQRGSAQAAAHASKQARCRGAACLGLAPCTCCLQTRSCSRAVVSLSNRLSAGIETASGGPLTSCPGRPTGVCSPLLPSTGTAPMQRSASSPRSSSPSTTSRATRVRPGDATWPGAVQTSRFC